MSGPTLGTLLAACLQQAGMACNWCGGYGWTVVAEDFAYVECPMCHGDGIAQEFKQEYDSLGAYADEEARHTEPPEWPEVERTETIFGTLTRTHIPPEKREAYNRANGIKS